MKMKTGRGIGGMILTGETEGRGDVETTRVPVPFGAL